MHEPQPLVEQAPARREQTPFELLMLDVSGDSEIPKPVSLIGDQCRCCGLRTAVLWDGARAALPTQHPVCTLCYLTGHLDSPTAAHGRLAFLPGMQLSDVNHLQRRALLSILGGSKSQRRDGQQMWRWLVLHAREVETAIGTAKAGEVALAMKRLTPSKRTQLRTRLSGCALILPADMFEDDLSLLLPAGKTVAAALSSFSWDTYTRSDLYAERNALG